MDFFGFNGGTLGGGGGTWGGGNIIGGGDWGSGGGSGINWQSVINQGFGLGSQAIGAWGHNPTQQIGGAGVLGIGQGYSPAAILNASGGMQRPPTGVISNPGLTGANGGVAEDALGSLSRFVTQHSGMVFIGIAAMFLLYRQPPSRR